MARIAIVDLLFNWPPDGGARTDVKEVAQRLAQDHEICIFVPDFCLGFPRGQIKGDFPVKVKKVSFNKYSFNFIQIARRFKREVDKYKPDTVFITDGWYLKPYLVNALKKYKPILRFYAYESLCLRGHGIFYNKGKLCEKNYLNGSFICACECLKCSIDWLKKVRDKKFVHEFLTAFVFSPLYLWIVRTALRNSGKIIVYNDFIKNKVICYNKNVLLIPSGVDINLFKNKGNSKDSKIKIFMAGRIEDDLKGASVLFEACMRLNKDHYKFELLLTTDREFEQEYITSVGWLSQEDLADFYQKVDICVIPSVWPEPFGIVALEAMASGKSVIVTRVGGLQHIIENNKEGFVVEPNDVDDLTIKLKYLIDNPEIRERMGCLGREKVENNYDWDIIYKKHYVPLFVGK
ncbi:MAG: glycosyltransferase family 4 protein [Candidatus Omnitrophica bacterium]|nr:glycosyltransferase family 4 protein [Candidatus Omnitrophota bacterium]